MVQYTASIRTRFATTVVTTVAIAALATASFAPADVHAQGRRFRDKQEARQEKQKDKKEKKDKHDEHDGQETERRAGLEQTYRQRAESVVRERLDLNDDQMRKLRDVNAKLETRRRALLREERVTRVALKAEVAKGKGADQNEVSKLMNKAQSLQQQRMALQNDERKQLSGFLTPVQQAKYFGLQARLRKRAQELEDAGSGPQ